MRGRKPKPIELHIAQGTYQPCRHKGKEAPVTIPPSRECPAWLKGHARAEWQRISGILEATKVLTAGDETLLAMYCRAYGEWRTLEVDIRRHGRTQKGDEGQEVRRPQIAMLAQAWAETVKLATEFGMSPSSRCRVRTVDKGKSEPKGKGRFFEPKAS